MTSHTFGAPSSAARPPRSARSATARGSDSKRKGPGSIKYTHTRAVLAVPRARRRRLRPAGGDHLGRQCDAALVERELLHRRDGDDRERERERREPDLLQLHVQGVRRPDQALRQVDAHRPTGADGDAFSFALLDQMLRTEKTNMNRAFVMSAAMADRYRAAWRALGAAAPTDVVEGFGPVETYRKVPILEDDFIGVETVGATTTCQSIYLASLDETQGLALACANAGAQSLDTMASPLRGGHGLADQERRRNSRGKGPPAHPRHVVQRPVLRSKPLARPPARREAVAHVIDFAALPKTPAGTDRALPRSARVPFWAAFGVPFHQGIGIAEGARSSDAHPLRRGPRRSRERLDGPARARRSTRRSAALRAGRLERQREMLRRIDALFTRSSMHPRPTGRSRPTTSTSCYRCASGTSRTTRNRSSSTAPRSSRTKILRLVALRSVPRSAHRPASVRGASAPQDSTDGDAGGPGEHGRAGARGRGRTGHGRPRGTTRRGHARDDGGRRRSNAEPHRPSRPRQEPRRATRPRASRRRASPRKTKRGADHADRHPRSTPPISRTASARSRPRSTASCIARSRSPPTWWSARRSCSPAPHGRAARLHPRDAPDRELRVGHASRAACRPTRRTRAPCTMVSAARHPTDLRPRAPASRRAGRSFSPAR